MKKLIAVAAIVPVIAVLMAGSAASCDCRAVGRNVNQDMRCSVSCEPGQVAVCKDGNKSQGRYSSPPRCKCVKASK